MLINDIPPPFFASLVHVDVAFALCAGVRDRTMARAADQSLDATARVALFAAMPLSALAARFDRFDVSKLVPGAPTTTLTGKADIALIKDQPMRIAVEAINATPGPLDQKLLPVSALKITASGTAENAVIDAFNAQLSGGKGNAGRIVGSGTWKTGPWQLAFDASDVKLAEINVRWPALQVAGRLVLFFTEKHIDVHRANRWIPVLLPAALFVLALSLQSPWVAIFYALLYGMANGMITIVKATAMAQYVSRERAASLNGLLGFPTAVARAAAPSLLAALWTINGNYVLGLSVLTAGGAIAVIAFWAAQRRALLS